MTGKTHLLGGAATAVGLAILRQPASGDLMRQALQVATSSILCLPGSILPDIDLPTSMVGSGSRLLSVPINKLFGHRGFFHSAAFAILPILVVYILAPDRLWAAIALSAGIVSHIILDSINTAGVALLWPWKKRIHVIGIPMGGMGEVAVKAMLFCGIVLLVSIHFVS